MDRCTREGVWNRATLSRQRSAACGTDRRQRICRSPPRDESSTRGIGYEEAQPASCAGRSQRGETPKNRKIVEGENDLTRFKHAFQLDAGKATKLKCLPSSQTTAPGRAGRAVRYTNQGAISNRPTMAALKRSQIESKQLVGCLFL